MFLKKTHIYVIRKGILYGGALVLMVILAVFPTYSLSSAKEALLLCSENIIPSLFPFFVLSQILINTGFAKYAGRLISPVMYPLFRVSGTGGIAFLIGLISGYPSGAKSVCDLYHSGDLSKEDAERLLPFCNNSGPLFIIGAVGLGMLKSFRSGVMLYIIHIFSAIIAGFISGLLHKKSNMNNTIRHTTHYASCSNFGAVFSESIKSSVISILNVCGFIVFFRSVTAPVSALFPQGITGGILKGIAEVAGGISALSQTAINTYSLPVISFLLGFGGFCVSLQVMGIAKAESLSMKYYFPYKILQGILSFFLCIPFAKKYSAVYVFNMANAVNFETGNSGAAITSVFIICAFYFFILALRKNFKND